MQAQATNQLPDPLNRIEIRTVRRQKVERKAPGLRFPPIAVKFAMVIPGIVRDHHNPIPSPGADPFQLLEEVPARLCVEAIHFATVHEAAIAQANGAKVAHALAPGVVSEHRVGEIRWNPHPASRAVLLEMQFVHRP